MATDVEQRIERLERLVGHLFEAVRTSFNVPDISRHADSPGNDERQKLWLKAMQAAAEELRELRESSG